MKPAKRIDRLHFNDKREINIFMDIQRTALRLPRDLHTKVIDSAEQNNRTMNAEIVDRLEKSFSNEEDRTLNDVQITADAAKRIAEQARANLYESAKTECSRLISEAARKGMNRADFDFVAFAGLSEDVDIQEQELLYQKCIIPLVAHYTKLGYHLDVEEAMIYIDF